MERSGWCSSYVAVATLLRPRMKFHRLRHMIHQMRLGCDQTVESGDQVTWSPFRREEGGESLVESPFGHVAKLEW